MLKLGVNIDHIATLRQARYKGRDHGEPDPVALALVCEKAGAHGITAHLREDRRHIIDRDIFALRAAITTRLNLEMGNTPEIVELALKAKPHIVCLVPEHRQEVTTEGGLDAVGSLEALKATTARLNDAGIEVSLFLDPELKQMDAARAIGAQFIELHTGAYAEKFHSKRDRNMELDRLVAAARHAHALGLGVNAGHGLNLENLPLLHIVPHMVELNIGHSIISRAIEVGLATAVKDILKAMDNYPG